MKGLDAYKEYVESFEPEVPEANLPKLQIFSSCKTLIYTIPLCVYDNKDRVTGKPAEDVKEFVGDDPYDTWRYLVVAAEEYMTGETQHEADFRAKAAEIAESLKQNNDQTSYYRRMEHIERTQKPVIRPVHRFRRSA
jgi:hypothetical protein